MIEVKENRIDATLNQLFKDSKLDYVRMTKVAAKSIFGPSEPIDFKDVYLSISKEQGKDLVAFIKQEHIKNIVEFGTSFGISTLFLAKGVIETEGKIITTELIESKAEKAIENFRNAGVEHLIELRIGDALETLKNHKTSIDLLLLDGWKDLYLPLFRMLEPNFHANTIIYVDNADMIDTQIFLRAIYEDSRYESEFKYNGKVVLIRIKNK